MMGDVATAPIDVAVGILVRDDGAFLLAQRPAGKPMAGYWEFPGGKLEAGETVFDALVREFQEELSVVVHVAHPWVRRIVTYPHATVRLHFWRSVGEGRGWSGAPQSNEGQEFRWEHIDHLSTTPWLIGAQPVKRWLRLPPILAISDAGRRGVDDFLARLDARLADGTVTQLLLREPTFDAPSFARLFDEVEVRCAAVGARLVVSSRHPSSFWARADGVQLTSRDLQACPARPDVDWCFASCHTMADLAQADRIGADAAVLGPVRATASHPGDPGIGWQSFARIARDAALPVYALGGLAQHDLAPALAAGAHGVAMMSAAWTAT
jgi:8-oxo-dGTP diphosphatase